MNSEELRIEFLENSKDVLDKVFYLLSGEDDAVINPWEREAINVLYPTIHSIITNASDLKKIDAQTTKAIIYALSKGKITADEALKLMSMKKVQFEVEELPELMKQVQD